jgi:hypothetical protein
MNKCMLLKKLASADPDRFDRIVAGCCADFDDHIKACPSCASFLKASKIVESGLSGLRGGVQATPPSGVAASVRSIISAAETGKPGIICCATSKASPVQTNRPARRFLNFERRFAVAIAACAVAAVSIYFSFSSHEVPINADPVASSAYSTGVADPAGSAADPTTPKNADRVKKQGRTLTAGTGDISPAVPAASPRPVPKGADGSAGKFTKINGPVRYASGENSDYVNIDAAGAVKIELCCDDRILTGAATTGEIVFLSGATLDVAGDTLLQIGLNGVKIDRGGIWVNYKPVRSAGGKITFNVKTPVGTIGIKGTRFSVIVSGTGNTEVCVTEGTVIFDSSANKGSMEITAGYKILVEKGLDVPEPVRLGETAISPPAPFPANDTIESLHPAANPCAPADAGSQETSEVAPNEGVSPFTSGSGEIKD